MPKTPEQIAAEAAAAAKVAADKAAADKLAADKAAEEAAQGFPGGTPIEQMTVEQREAYWKHQARKHEKRANERGDYDALKAAADELAALKLATATDEDKARDEARREGEVIGAEKYLKDAVMGRFQALTNKSDEDVEAAFQFVDAKSFTDDKGNLDVEKIKTFAGAFGSSGESQSTDRVAEALARQRQAGGGAGTTISDKREETRKRMTPTKA
jgi:hypothetical protein